MKKIYYLLAFVALAFTACQKQPYITPATYTKAMTLTLAHSDYLLLPTTAYPYKTFTFDSPDDANKYIPMILNARDPQLGDGSTASVTYATTALTLPATPKLIMFLTNLQTVTICYYPGINLPTLAQHKF